MSEPTPVVRRYGAWRRIQLMALMDHAKYPERQPTIRDQWRDGDWADRTAMVLRLLFWLVVFAILDWLLPYQLVGKVEACVLLVLSLSYTARHPRSGAWRWDALIIIVLLWL